MQLLILGAYLAPVPGSGDDIHIRPKPGEAAQLLRDQVLKGHAPNPTGKPKPVRAAKKLSK